MGDTQHHCQILDGFLRKIIQILTILITDSHIWSCSLANSWIMILRLHPKMVRLLHTYIIIHGVPPLMWFLLMQFPPYAMFNHYTCKWSKLHYLSMFEVVLFMRISAGTSVKCQKLSGHALSQLLQLLTLNLCGYWSRLVGSRVKAVIIFNLSIFLVP